LRFYRLFQGPLLLDELAVAQYLLIGLLVVFGYYFAVKTPEVLSKGRVPEKISVFVMNTRMNVVASDFRNYFFNVLFFLVTLKIHPIPCNPKYLKILLIF
jgi:hypothetical protein